jgi:hypothetical protein
MNPICYAVYTNRQGSKQNGCPFHHTSLDEEGAIQHRRGDIVQLSCDVKLHCFTPIFEDGVPSARSMAIISYGQHNHPPPPPARIPPDVKERVLTAIHAYGIGEATTRRMTASISLPIMLNGATSLSQEHITLTNHDVVNYLIRKERVKAFPWGTDVQVVQHAMAHQNQNVPYIRRVEVFDDGRFLILCQSRKQSEQLMHCFELQADKTFKRTKAQEFEINSLDPVTKGIVTLVRVYTDHEDEWGYYQAFKSVFDQAEKDMGYRVPFGHLTTTDEASPSGTRIKAILLDEHQGQIRGLGRYLHSEYPHLEKKEHILSIVKTCKVHYDRSIRKLRLRDNTDIHHRTSILLFILIIRSLRFASRSSHHFG